MGIASLGLVALLWAAYYGEDYAGGGVIKIEPPKSDGLWHIVAYGESTHRKIDPACISHFVVDGKAKNPFTGRLLIDEMRELLKSKEIVSIHFNKKDDLATAVALERNIGLKLILEDAPP